MKLKIVMFIVFGTVLLQAQEPDATTVSTEDELISQLVQLRNSLHNIAQALALPTSDTDVTKVTEEEDKEQLITDLVNQIASDIQFLAEQTQTQLDALFDKTLEQMSNSTDTVTSFQAWLTYLDDTVHENFKKEANAIISNFTSLAHNIDLVEFLKENGIDITQQLRRMEQELILYKEALRDKIFSTTDEYIDAIDLRELVYEELIGQLGTIEWHEKLANVEKIGKWQIIKNFVSDFTNSFIKQAKPKLEEKLVEAGINTGKKIRDDIWDTTLAWTGTKWEQIKKEVPKFIEKYKTDADKQPKDDDKQEVKPRFEFKDMDSAKRAIIGANTSVFVRDNLLISWGVAGNREHDEAVTLWNDLVRAIETYVKNYNNDLIDAFNFISTISKTIITTLDTVYKTYIQNAIIDAEHKNSGIKEIDKEKIDLKAIGVDGIFALKNDLRANLNYPQSKEELNQRISFLATKHDEYRKSLITPARKGDVADVLNVFGLFVQTTLEKVAEKDFERLETAVSDAVFGGGG